MIILDFYLLRKEKKKKKTLVSALVYEKCALILLVFLVFWWEVLYLKGLLREVAFTCSCEIWFLLQRAVYKSTIKHTVQL